MISRDICWIQRFNHYSLAFAQLTKFIKKGTLNQFEKQGLIKSFEYTFELAWNVIKDYFESQGETNLHGSRDVFRLAFQRGVVENGEVWMDMISSRTLTSHTYNEELAQKITETIIQKYFPEFMNLHRTLESLSKELS